MMSLSNYELIEAKRNLINAKSRSSSITSIDRGGTRSPKFGLKSIKLTVDTPESETRRSSIASSVTSSSAGRLKWIAVDGVWKRVMLQQKDDFEGEDEDGANNNETGGSCADVPNIIIASADMFSKHVNEASNCTVSNTLPDETVNCRNLLG